MVVLISCERKKCEGRDRGESVCAYVCVCERERCDLVSLFVYVCFLNCNSKLYILLCPGASDKFLSLWPFSLYYCVKLMLSVNTDILVVCSKFYFVFAFFY